MDKLFIIKIGGNIIDNAQQLDLFLSSFAAIPAKKILVHGGGKKATDMAAQLQLPQQVINGRRITDAETLRLVVMVYAGLINKQIVAQLQSKNINAVGICGADGNTIRAEKRAVAEIDYGFVGDVTAVDTSMLQSLIEGKMVPIVAPITHDKEGQLLNTNADTIAQELSIALAAHYDVELMYAFEKNGVLYNAADENSVVEKISRESFEQLVAEKKIHGGMLPKLHNAFAALEKGIQKIYIGHALDVLNVIAGKAGTTIVK